MPSPDLVRSVPPEPPFVFEVPARFALYLRYRVQRLCEDAAHGKLDTIAPFMLAPDGPPVTVTFSDASADVPHVLPRVA